jgi:hypothetical protein
MAFVEKIMEDIIFLGILRKESGQDSSLFYTFVIIKY